MGDQRPIILLDVSPGEDGEFDRSILERMGHDVAVCHGPAHDQLCPLLAGTGCELADRAHGVVFALDLERAQHRAILHRYRELMPEDVPIRAVVQPGQREKYADLLADFEIWEHQPTVAELDGFAAEVDAAERVLGR